MTRRRLRVGGTHWAYPFIHFCRQRAVVFAEYIRREKIVLEGAHL